MAITSIEGLSQSGKDVRVRLPDGRVVRAFAKMKGSKTAMVHLRAVVGAHIIESEFHFDQLELDEGCNGPFEKEVISNAVNSGSGRALRDDAVASLLLYGYSKIQKNDGRYSTLRTVPAIDDFFAREYGWKI